MNTGARAQDTFIQANHRTTEQDASHSALLYLLQEVSRLTSPVHNSYLDPKSPSTIHSRSTRQDDFIVQNKEVDGHSFHTVNSPCQQSLSGTLPCNGVSKVEESHGGMFTAMIEPNGEFNSPWKVLSLINLQCERLQHQRDAEEPSVIISGGQASVTHEEDVMMRGEVSGGLSINESQHCAKDSMVGCTLSSQPAEKTDSVIPEPEKETATAFFSRAHTPRVPSNSQTCHNSNENTSEDLPKSELTLDCNANIVLTTKLPCDAQLSSQSSAQTSSQALPCAAERCHPRPRNDNELTRSDPESVQVLTEETLTPVEQLKSSSYNLSPAKLQAELRPLQKEEIAPLTSLQWRIKTPRKQPHPSRSVDIQDPDIQGVTFRMGTELDDNREQCRLLITSKYSKEILKSVRKPRPKTRTSQKSVKTSSSDEESDPTTPFSKGKVCASCCTRKTPMWRDAEDGTPLCNACGIRYKKYRVRCVNCWHIPRKEGNSNSCCLKCGNSVRLTSAQRKHTA